MTTNPRMTDVLASTRTSEMHQANYNGGTMVQWWLKNVNIGPLSMLLEVEKLVERKGDFSRREENPESYSGYLNALMEKGDMLTHWLRMTGYSELSFTGQPCNH